MDGAAKEFPLRVPLGFARRMRKGDADDPLLRQVLPLGEESIEAPGFVADPVGDASAQRGAGLLRKYQGRALLVTTSACAVHCRYCFRRHFPYQKQGFRRDMLQVLDDQLASDSSLGEIILSGGDPLMLSDARLTELATLVRGFSHVRRLRIHTRLPVILPERITGALVDAIASTSCPAVVVLHINHPREIDDAVAKALHRLRREGITLLNQAVLLAGVNDDSQTQIDLAETCFDAGVLPYYLHALDPVAGAAHFAVSDSRALDILAAMRRRLPGYLVPRLVREEPGAPCKLPLEVSCADSEVG